MRELVRGLDMEGQWMVRGFYIERKGGEVDNGDYAIEGATKREEQRNV